MIPGKKGMVEHGRQEALSSGKKKHVKKTPVGGRKERLLDV